MYLPCKSLLPVIGSILCALLLTFSTAIQAATVTCGENGPETLDVSTGGNDLKVINNVCTVKAGTYNFLNVNIYQGGTLKFENKVIDFWAESILIEDKSALLAGTPEAPIGSGSRPGQLTIHLYGADQLVAPLSQYRMGSATKKGNKGIVCQTEGGTCGVPTAIWNSNIGVPVGDGNYPTSVKSVLPGRVRDYFYQYAPLPFDDGETDGKVGYFGRKVLALSYGGTLKLFGKKGASYTSTADCDKDDPANSCTSWARLNIVRDRALMDNGRRVHSGLQPKDRTLSIDRDVDWQHGDKIVVTTTDYLPGHSEEFTIDSINGRQINFTSGEPDGGAKYFHNGERYTLHELPARMGITKKNAEIRAAVGLLTRSIRIVSEGDTFSPPGDDLNPNTRDSFPAEPGKYFGGHTLVRQGFKSYQIQGVEFHRLGQGGRMGHYPVHFHQARKTPADTFVKDSSINESMTRWITIHGTHGVTLARNVGFKSIGHGYYLEDATEINNKLYSNLGVFARAAVDNIQNPRKVPGILARTVNNDNISFIDTSGAQARIQSDYAQPTVFWITNTWNDFQYNMAVGAGTCGACYWPIPAIISGASTNKRWDSYASLQRRNQTNNQGTAPIKKFLGNFCSTAMHSFNTAGDTSPCNGLGLKSTVDYPKLVPIFNPLIPLPASTPWFEEKYFPRVNGGNSKTGTRCDADSTGSRITTDKFGELEVDCTFVDACKNEGEGVTKDCMINVVDSYTTSFSWAETNFGAVWLRGSQWYLILNSIISDIQNGGLSIVTGGDYTASSAINGHWGLIRKTLFIGNTQDKNPFASSGGPFIAGGLACDSKTPGNYCLSADEGISMQMSNFGMNQRLFNIYDGPSFQDSNAYLDISTRPIDNCKLNPGGEDNQSCVDSESMYGRVTGLPADKDGICHMPNAAIGWKQPNGFYYPPAFHSSNLFFDEVDIRHFVLEPLFLNGTLEQDNPRVKQRYCTRASDMFSAGFTHVDRQTVLNDDDGSLTGLVETISVNEDPFFNAPVETEECRSGSPSTAKTSPYDYLTTVVYPKCAITTEENWVSGDPPTKCDAPAIWGKACSNALCYGVPIYRQFLTDAELKVNPSQRPNIRMMGSALYQRNSLTVNHGNFYIDTTVTEAAQIAALENEANKRGQDPNLNVFTANETYYTFLLFAKANTKQTYQMYVGTDPGADYVENNVKMTRVNPKEAPFTFTDKTWPSNWTRTHDPQNGVLTIKIDLSNIQKEINTAKETQCLPKSVCKWENNQCVTSLSPGDYLYDEFDEGNICDYAVKAVDCPAGGCYGFSVTLPGPDKFILPPPTGITNLPPATIPFSADPDFNWNVTWKKPADPTLPGDCINPAAIPTQPLPLSPNTDKETETVSNDSNNDKTNNSDSDIEMEYFRLPMPVSKHRVINPFSLFTTDK